MSFIEVEDPSRHAERAQRAHAAYAEHYLLSKPAVGLGHVQAVGDPAEVRWVGLEVRVEQVKLHAPDLGAPYTDAH